ncbi:MAG TPA: hypothetical protein ENF34_04580 [Candidatus Bathyarchaeota archaeon]|nr:hypothetical protein [Candidatus Bathyarchaeota archaeon]
MGRIAKGQRCSVIGCDAPAVRSLPASKVLDAGLRVEKGRRAYLCREHYKEFKRRTKKERRIERWKFMAWI